MTSEAGAAFAIIRRCLEDERYIVTRHFAQRMEERGLMWPDVMTIFDDPTDIRDGGPDNIGHPKWIVTGDVVEGLAIEIVCAIDDEESSESTVFITIYWED